MTLSPETLSQAPPLKRAVRSPFRQAEVKVLLLEDDGEDAAIIQDALERYPGTTFTVRRVDRLRRAIDYLRRSNADVAIVDLFLPDGRGVEVPEAIHSTAPGLPFVVLTGIRDEEIGLIAIEAGAQDFICKSEMTPVSLSRAVKFAIERSRSRGRRR